MQRFEGWFRDLQSALPVFRRRGFRAGARALARRFVRLVATPRQDLFILARAVSGEPVAEAAPPELEIAEVRDPATIAALGRLAPRDAARFRRMFADGSVVIVARQGGEIAGWAWVSERVDEKVNPMQPALRPGDLCLHDLFVVPAHRGKGIARWLHRRRLALAEQRGFERAQLACVKSNATALKVARRAGYRVIGEMTHRRYLLWNRIQRSSRGGRRADLEARRET